MSPNLVFLINLVCTWYLVGLIWMVQVVHYNLFDRVGESAFVQYESDHTRLITPIVVPPMMLELVTAAWLLSSSPAGLPRWAVIAAFAFVILIWLSTFLIQVPLHSRLVNGFSPEDCRKLVDTNWIRTVLWSTRGVWLAWYAHKLMQ